MKRTLLLLCALLAAYSATAQEQKPSKASAQQRADVRSGNKAYNRKAYTDAEAAYLKASDSANAYHKAEYNLGNALYRQKAYDRAAQHYERALQSPHLTPRQKAQAHHNLGNAHLQQGVAQRDGKGGGRQELQQAVQSYQEALKLDPKNHDTKYNLSYAKKLLAQAESEGQGGGGGQNNQQQDPKGNQKQQQNAKPQGQQNQQQDQQQGQGQPNQDQQKKQPSQPQQREQQRQDAERLLNAVRNNEKNTLRDQQKQQQGKVDGRIEKDW